MTIAAIDATASAKPRVGLDAVPLWLWWLLALAAATTIALFAKGPGQAFEFIDSDDALRLIHMRELLAGTSWFEITTGKLGGSDGLLSHWSRLIDGPLALLYAFFRLVLPDPLAQKVLVTVWPTMMLGAALWAIARTTREAAGMRAALFSLVFGATSLLAYYQFAPGRIDHHNVMIASTLSAALIVWAWPRDVRLWRWSGVLCAVALAVGYEALAPVFLIAGLVAAWGLVDREKAREAEAFVVGLAATLAAVLVATVAPSRWMTIYCDALSLNLVVLAACGGAGYVAVVRNPAWSWTKRIAVLCVAGGAGITGFGWLEPACLAGPMGQVPADVGAAWLAQVDETKSVLREFLRGEITGTIAPVLIFAAGIAVGAIAFARSTNASDRFYLAAAAGFVVLGLWQMKYIAYASLILVPGIAVFAARLQPFGSLSGPVVTASAIVMLNQFTLFTLAGILRPAAAPAAVATAPANATAREVQAPSPQLACSRGDALRALDAAPSGLVVTHNDIGAHLAAATYHRALSGPYHRIPRAIMTNGEILAAKDAGAAGRLLAREQVDYVLTCEPMDKAQLARPGWSGSLLATLAANQPPAFLKPVALPDAPLYRLWRVDRQHLPLP